MCIIHVSQVVYEERQNLSSDNPFLLISSVENQNGQKDKMLFNAITAENQKDTNDIDIVQQSIVPLWFSMGTAVNVTALLTLNWWYVTNLFSEYILTKTTSLSKYM